MLAVTMVPHKSDLSGRAVSVEEGRKMSRSQTDLKKCLGNHIEELLLKNYSCAWQKEILVQGHLLITANHFCFYSSILGFETKTIINVADIVSIKKEKTAHFIPNAIVIATEEKKYRFSMFVSRNKTYNILQIVWENSSSFRPLSEDLLLAKIRLLKVKSKSTETSPLSSPNHPTRHPILHLSRSTGHTDSDSSGTSSPILLSRTLTPPPSNPPPPTIPQTLSASPSRGSPGKIVGVAPRVVVTTSNEEEDQLRGVNGDFPDTGSSRDSLFLDAIDSSSKLSNPNSNQRLGLLNLNSDSVDTISDIGSCGDMDTSTTSDSDTEFSIKSQRLAREFQPSIHSISSVFEGDSGGRIVGSASREEDTTEKRGFTEAPAASSNKDTVTMETRGEVLSVLKVVLDRVNIHPNTIGLWRLQRGLNDWCTPSNFINLLILVSIFLLLLSTASMLCRLSYVSPALQPFIAWQPWCRLCTDCRGSSVRPHPPGGVSSEQQQRDQGVWTLARFEELVRKHTTSSESADNSHSNKIASQNQQT